MSDQDLRLEDVQPLPYMNHKQIQNSISTQDSAYQFTIDTLTQIEKDILTHAKFYEFKMSSYVPVRVGYGAFQQNLIRLLTAPVGGSFWDGLINTGNNSRLSKVTTTVKPMNVPILNWGKQVGYSIFDVYQAMMSLNFDLITNSLEARKKEWDLGLQEICMLGHPTDTSVTGLLNNANVTPNTTTITDMISTLGADDFQNFVAILLAEYFANTNSTTVPNRFVIPASDYLGLGAAASAQFPNISKIKYLEDAFKVVLAGFGIGAGDPEEQFKILPQAYCELAQMSTRSANVYRYALYRHNKETMTMNIPVDLTATQFNSLDNFNFQNVGYGQFTGTAIYRDLEVMYFDHT